MTINIKPHHLLDIFKLYGRGVYPFVPDVNFKHDFYRIGNGIIDKDVEFITFTAKSDDICIPCIYCIDGVCVDSLTHSEFKTKNDYNYAIDKNILSNFLLAENSRYEIISLLSNINNTISLELINKVWVWSDENDNKQRFANTVAGIRKFLYR